MQREIDQRRGQHRDRQRDQQQVAGKPVHRLPQRRLVDHDLDELRAARRRPDDADRLVAGLQHDLEGIDDRRPHRHRPHVDVMVDRRRQIGAGEQPALLPHLDRHRPRADAGQDLPRQRIRHHAGGRGIEHQRRGIGRRQAVVEPVHPEIRDRGHIDQDAGDHHQRDGQQQQLAGQAEPARRLRPRRCRFGCSSVTDTISAFEICLDDQARRISLGWQSALTIRMRAAPDRSNYGSLMSAGSSHCRAAILALKNTAKIRYIRANCDVSKKPRLRHPRNIDENRSLPYKPRQLSAMARSDRGGSFGPETARFGPASITGLTSIGTFTQRQIARSAENDP